MAVNDGKIGFWLLINPCSLLLVGVQVTLWVQSGRGTERAEERQVGFARTVGEALVFLASPFVCTWSESQIHLLRNRE